jgi:hypothetical protein
LKFHGNSKHLHIRIFNYNTLIKMAYYGGGNNMPAGGGAFGGFAGGYNQGKEFSLVKNQIYY